jgi:hypothetical protein
MGTANLIFCQRRRPGLLIASPNLNRLRWRHALGSTWLPLRSVAQDNDQTIAWRIPRVIDHVRLAAALRVYRDVMGT